MKGIAILALTGGIWLVQATGAEAQVTFSKGNPAYGTGPSITLGNPAPNYSYQPGYNSPYGPGYGAYDRSRYGSYYPQPSPYRGSSPPATTYYHSGYRGYSSSSPYYDRGYYGSTYVTPNPSYDPRWSGYGSPGAYVPSPSVRYYNVR